MFLDYLTSNFMTLMLLSSLVIIMLVNYDAEIPEARLFTTGIVLMLILTVLDTAETWISDIRIPAGEENYELIRLRTHIAATSYILRPTIIMLQLYIVIPDKKFIVPCALPAMANAAVYSTAFSGNHFAFWIDSSNQWHRGPFGTSVIIVQIIYVLTLLWFSIVYFRKDKVKISFIVLLIFVQAIIASYLEVSILPGFANTMTALGMLEYYICLVVMHQQEMRRTLTEKELAITKSTLLVLRNQIQPHFIYNTLSIIRSLTKKDKDQAVKCIDSFSKYLRLHIGAIQNDDLIPFESELENMQLYLSLAQVDYNNKIDVIYELGTTDFLIPSLSLETIVENAIYHGMSSTGGQITIKTTEENDNIIISISDNSGGKADAPENVPLRNGIGLKNTRTRIMLQCGGDLMLDIKEDGATAIIKLPKERVKR